MSRIEMIALRRASARPALLSSGLLPPLLALLAYAPVLSHGLLWDDPVILERQLPGLTVGAILSPPAGLYQWTYHYYRPVTMLSLLLDSTLFGTEPLGYHATVWLLHAVAVYAVFRLALRLMPRGAAVLAASLFAVFPLHAECVSWIAGRNDILAGLFCATAAGFFMGGLGIGPEGRRGEPSSARLGAGALAFLLALFSKESAIALAPLPLAAAWLCNRRSTVLVRAALASGLPVVVTLAARGWLNPQQASEVLAEGSAPPLGAVLASAIYFPVRLVIPFFGSAYRLAPPEGVIYAAAAIALAAGGIALWVWAWRRRRIDVALALLWILVMIAAAAGASAWNITRTPVADRYLYLPAVGWSLLLAALLAGGRTAMRPVPAAAAWILVALFAAAGLVRRPVYANDLAYWSAAIASEPGSGAARLNYGNALARLGRLEGAREAYAQALERPLSEMETALALTDLGAVLYQAGKLAEAEGVLRKAASLPAASSTVHFNLGALLFQKAVRQFSVSDVAGGTGAIREAQRHLEIAVRQEGTHVRALMLLGHCYMSEGRRDEARRAWQRIIQIEGPDGYVGREAAMALSRTE